MKLLYVFVASAIKACIQNYLTATISGECVSKTKTNRYTHPSATGHEKAMSFFVSASFDQFHSIQTEIIEETNHTLCLSLIEFFFGCKCHYTGKSYYRNDRAKLASRK